MRTADRRRFLVGASALLAAARVGAQDSGRLPVLGILHPHRKRTPEEARNDPLTIRLRELGWVNGQTLRTEVAAGEGREDRLPDLAAMLVAKKVDTIWALGPEAAVAAARATRTIPIVFWGVAYPVEQGLVESLARPGRNVTGVAWHASPEVDSKRIELLRELAPAAKRLAIIAVPTTLQTVMGGTVKIPPSSAPGWQRLGYEARTFAVEKAEDFDAAFPAILEWGAQALSVAGTTLTFRERDRIVGFANRNRLPSAFTLLEYVEAGGLASYAIDWRRTFAQTASHIDRILRGARPGDLPVELPTHYVTAINLKTAKALGFKVPESVLIRADRVIE